MEAQKAVEDQNVDVKNEVSVEKKKQPEPSTTTEDDKPAGAEISDREESSISVQDKDIPNDAAKGGTDTEEAGYKSDQSASEEGSTDNVVDRQRSKGSSGYEESDDYEEGEGSDVSEGQRMGNEDEEKEYDEGVSDNESSDVVIEESQSENGTEGYEEDREDESRDDEEFREELDKEDPQSVPRKTGFWDHDDRFEEISVEESRPPKGDRQLWDITSERWQHDKYVEAEQGPRSLREIEESEKQFERRNRRRNDRKLGDFMRGGRGRRGGGSGGGGRGGGGRNERGPEDEDEYQQKDRRGPSSHLRGSPRGRGDFRHRRTERTPKESEYIEWGGDEEAIDNTNETVEHFDDLQTERINEKSSKDSKKHADTDIRSNVQHEKETYKRQVEQSHTKSPESKQSAQKQDSTKVKHEHEISRSRMKEENRQTGQSNVKSQESKQSAPKKQESAEEHRGPRGRGKGMTSKKITSAKKSAVDFRKERKKSEEHGDEEVYEDAEENIREEPDAAQQKHAVKPKRYSTQRQKQATANEGAPNQTDESVIQDQQYFDANLQGNYQPQDIAFNPNMMILLQQLQQMQMQQQQQQQMQQQQSVQQQQPVQQQQQSMPTQVPGGQNQGPAVLTPLMQQYMQQQLMNMQALQQAYAQQQQQMQQQMQGLRMSQQPTMPSGEPQGPAPEGGMMMPRNAFPNVSQSMPHYNIIQQNQPGIYPQTGGTQYVEQMMSAPQPPSQQSGLYIPQVQQVSQQQGPDETVEQYAQRKARPAAIPIKPPPEVQ